MRKSGIVLFTVTALTLLASGQARADRVMGLNFTENTTTALAGKTADGFSNWADGGLTGSGLVLPGGGGLVTCDWLAPQWWHAGDSGTPDEQLYYSYLEDSSDGPQITLTGLSDWLAAEGSPGYIIRIYQSDNNTGDTFSPVYVYPAGMTLRKDQDNDGVQNDYLDKVQADNMWGTDGGTRAYVDTHELTADTITIDTGWRSLGSKIRSNVAAIKITAVDPYLPVNPVPAVGVEVPATQILSWEQDPLAANQGVFYDVYVGTEPNALNPNYYGLTPVKTTTDDPSDFYYVPVTELDNEATYYWRVDAWEPNVLNPGAYILHEGTEWWFTTQPASARIESDPTSMTVAAGTAEVSFMITALNATSYQWYKDGMPLFDDVTDTLYTGENSPTLTVYDVQVADEGFYHCVADNRLNLPAASASAQLITERQVSWWKLDGDLTDSIDELYAGAAIHDGISLDPNYVTTGISGSALELEGVLEDVVTVVGSAEFLNFYPRGYTVSLWVNKPLKSGSNWETYLSKQANGRGFGLYNNHAGQPVSVLRQSYNDLFSNTDVDDEQWHLVTATYDAVLREGRIYIDGALRNQAVNSGVPAGNTADLIFGTEFADNIKNIYTGLLDDVRIWSYPLDAIEVGTLYTDYNPGSEICVVNPEYDIAGPQGVGAEYRDCRVNLYDLVPIAQSWMECNLIPTCLQ